MQWFKHMSNMRHDTKIKRLINKYGIEGYGLYCLILESIVEKLSDNNPNPSLEDTCEDIAAFYKNDTTKVNEMACFMMNQGLLELDEITERITCHKIYKYLQQNATSSDKIRELISSYKKSQLLVIESQQNVNRQDKTRQKKNRQDKKRYGSLSNVFLLEKEYNKLIDEYEKSIIDKYIESLSTYIPNRKSTPYKDHNAVLRNWLNKDNIPKQKKIEIPEDSKIDLNEEWI